MIDRPDAHRLLDAVAAALSDEVVPVLSSTAEPDAATGARYVTRIAANLCLILARECQRGRFAEAATISDIRALLGRDDGSIDELVAALDDALRDGGAGLDPVAVQRVLAANVERRLAIARPSYAQPAERRNPL